MGGVGLDFRKLSEVGGWVCGGMTYCKLIRKCCAGPEPRHTHPPQAGPAHTSAGDPGSSGRD